jgi:purine-binding chemotaxis protein CheW
LNLYIVFAVAEVEYALPVSTVLQMDAFTGATAIPGAPSYVAGIVNVRGSVVPVVDLRLRFGLAAAPITPDTRVVVVEFEGRVLALRADRAREVVKLDESKHQAAPAAIAERSSGFVQAVHALGNRLLLLLELSQVLGENSHDDQQHRLLPDSRQLSLPD